MKKVISCVRRYAILAIFILLIGAVLIVSKVLQDAFLREIVITTTTTVDMLAAAVEAEPGRPWYDHEFNIRDGVEVLDNVPQVYAAAFKVVDGEHVLFTERFTESSPFEPFDYPEFESLIAEQDYGAVVINYTPEGQSARDLHVYFRWMPLYSRDGEQYLVVAGVSKYSIVSKAYIWISVVLWVVIAAVAVPMVRCIFKNAECGNVPREKKTRDRGRLRLSALKKSG